MYEAGDPSALGLDGAGECLISVPGIHIFGSLGRRELKSVLPTRQTKSSERGGNPRVRRHSAVGPQHPNTPPNGAHLRKQNARDTALCFLRIAHPLIETAAPYQHWR